MRCSSLVASALTSTLVALAPTLAFADDLPKGTSGDQVKATKGTTDVTSQGFEAAAKEKADESKDATELSVQAGGLSSSGNSRLFAATGSGTLRLRRDENQFSMLLAGNYSKTALHGQDAQTTVENAQGRIRYDRFFAKDFAFFLGVQARRDRFQGLELRTQIDPGIAYYFVNEKTSLLWVELGYDYLHDIRRDDALVDATGKPIVDASGNTLDKTKSVHSGRVFFGTNVVINEGVTFTAGVEYLQGLVDTTFWKLNADAQIASKLSKKFSLASAFSLRYDHAPLPGKEKIDTVTSLNLVYSFL